MSWLSKWKPLKTLAQIAPYAAMIPGIGTVGKIAATALGGYSQMSQAQDANSQFAGQLDAYNNGVAQASVMSPSEQAAWIGGADTLTQRAADAEKERYMIGAQGRGLLGGGTLGSQEWGAYNASRDNRDVNRANLYKEIYNRKMGGLDASRATMPYAQDIAKAQQNDLTTTLATLGELLAGSNKTGTTDNNPLVKSDNWNVSYSPLRTLGKTSLYGGGIGAVKINPRSLYV
jgi:hypothetical protein